MNELIAIYVMGAIFGAIFGYFDAVYLIPRSGYAPDKKQTIAWVIICAILSWYTVLAYTFQKH